MASTLKSSRPTGTAKAGKRAGVTRPTRLGPGKAAARERGKQQFVDPAMPAKDIRWCSHRRQVVCGSGGWAAIGVESKELCVQSSGMDQPITRAGGSGVDRPPVGPAAAGQVGGGAPAGGGGQDRACHVEALLAAVEHDDAPSFEARPERISQRCFVTALPSLPRPDLRASSKL